MSRRAGAILLCLIFAIHVARANPDRQVSQCGHTKWPIQDGVFEGAPPAMAQTTDGYLWIGTDAGLSCFDGVRFVPWTAPLGEILPSSSIQSLRQAFYSDLSAKYRSRAIAGNGDEVWNEVGATRSFAVEPACYQTMWFRWVWLGACGLGLWGIHRLRVRQIVSRLTALFDERMAERNRLSSELHDTFLQSVEASKMVADHALIEQPADPVRMRRAMETLSGWLAQATSDGRTALNTLRSSANVTNNLAEAFQRAAEVARAAGSMEFALSVEGTTRAIHPVVRDEVVRIGSEAIRNLCSHPGAGVLEVKIRYSHDLRIRVRDNGEAIVPGGEPGHSELAAMLGRAKRIGGELYVRNTRSSGTEIELKVPGRIAFRDGRQWSFLAKLRGLWRSADRDRN